MAHLARNEFLSFFSRGVFVHPRKRGRKRASHSLAGTSDVDETLFGNNNYRETRDMSKYSGCRGQRLALREHTYTSRVIQTRLCRSVIADSQMLLCIHAYTHTCPTIHGTASGSFKAERGVEAKGGSAVQPLTELDRFEKSWESAVACSRIALERQTRKERFAKEC